MTARGEGAGAGRGEAVVELTVNGAPQRLPAGSTVADLLEHLGVDARRVAVERNRAIVRRAQHDSVALAEGDRVEIVGFVGGG
jgi:thiamine biosynthesis protein ThiS